MTRKIILLLPIMVSCEFAYLPAQVYEPEIITSGSQFTDFQTEANNMPIYTAPSHFDFEEYQRRGQLDPQKYRYIQQQKSDRFHANYRDTRNDDQQFQPSEESSVRVQAPVGQNWQVIHPKFVTENVRDYVTVTSLPTTMMEYQNTNPSKQQNLLEKKEDMKKAGSYDKITPTLVPTEDSSRKGRIYKKSLLPNSYHLDEDMEIHPTQPFQERQDIGNLVPYVGYLNPDLNQQGKQYQNQDQLSALTSLLGKHPTVQLQGLNQLLGSQSPVYKKDHIPIYENQQDPEGINNQGQRNNQNQQQNYPTLNNNVLENAIIAQTQAIHQSGSASQDSFNNLQAQLDATAKLHADKIIAQAQQKALEHVQAQHKAIALAQVQAEKVALGQVQAQNEALVRAHAEAQAKAEQERIERERANVDENEKKDAARLQRLAEERRRFQEQIRQQALHRKLREREERERQEASKKQKQPEPLPVASALHQDAAAVAQKTRQKTQSKIDPAESQNQYYHQVPSYAASVDVPYKLQSIHNYSPETITLNAPKAPLKYISTNLHSIQTPSESFVDIHAAGYNQHTKSEEADVSKYFVPPQVTVEEYKNAKGQHDVSSPSVDDVVHEIFKLTRLDVARVRDKRSTNIQNLTVHDDVGYSIDYEYVLYDDDDPFDNGTILNYNQLTDGHLNIDYFYDDISDENNTTVDDHLNIVNEHGDGTISGSVVGEMLPVPEPLRRSFVHRHRYAKRKFPWTNKKRPHHYYTPHHSVKPHKYEVVENHHHDTYRQPYHHQITKKPLSIHNYKDHLPSKKDADATNVIVINNSNDNHEHKSQLTHDHGHHYGGHVHGHGGPYHGRYKGHHHSGHHYRAPHKKPVQFVVRRRKPSKKTLKIINKIKAALRKVSHAG